MEPDTVLNLFDSILFYLEIFKKQSDTSTSSTPEQNPRREIQENPSQPNVVSSQLSIPSRSKSDNLSYLNTSLNPYISSPDSVLKPHLKTILSTKEYFPEIPKTQQFIKKPSKNLNKKKKRFSKSLSELEFEEMKGFMDLGFVFSEEDKGDSVLVEMIPGLQRLGEKSDDCDRQKGEEISVEELSRQRVRPYLSEAWEISEYERGKENPLINWRVPVDSNENGMKDSLKWWAHTVASAVR